MLTGPKPMGCLILPLRRRYRTCGLMFPNKPTSSRRNSMGKYQICVSGAAKGESVEAGKLLARSAGAAIAKAGHSLMTGATTGLPNEAAMGYKHAGGTMSLGISPASTKVEHVLKYRLPTEAYDPILYSGLHYS